MKKLVSVIVAAFLLLSLQQMVWADNEVKSYTGFGYTYGYSISGNALDNMGNDISGSGFYYHSLAKVDPVAVIISVKNVNFQGQESLKDTDPNGPPVGYTWDTKLTLNATDLSLGWVVWKYFIPYLGISFYSGEKTYDKMEPSPYYWEQVTDKTIFAFGFNEGLMVLIPLNDVFAISLSGEFNQVIFNKTIGGNATTITAAINFSTPNQQ